MRERLVVEYGKPEQNTTWGRLAPGKRSPTRPITSKYFKAFHGTSLVENYYGHDANSGLLCGHLLTGHLDGRRSLKQRPARGNGGAVIRENMASESKESVCVAGLEPLVTP